MLQAPDGFCTLSVTGGEPVKLLLNFHWRKNWKKFFFFNFFRLKAFKGKKELSYRQCWLYLKGVCTGVKLWTLPNDHPLLTISVFPSVRRPIHHLSVCQSDCRYALLYVCLCACQSIHLSVCPAVHLPVWLSICTTVCMSMFLSVHPSVFPSVRLSIHHLSVCLSYCQYA